MLLSIVREGDSLEVVEQGGLYSRLTNNSYLNGRRKCWHCTGKHAPQSRKFNAEWCFARGKTGHIARSKACRGKPRVQVVKDDAPDDNDWTAYGAYSVSEVKKQVCVEGKPFNMQLDTAADVSLLPENLYRQHFSHLPLQPAALC